jgi:hypothetical protein
MIHLNHVQRAVIVAAVACVGGILILHAPWDGYAYYNDIFDALSERALTFWFASLLHVWIAIAFVLAIALLIGHLFRSPSPRE